ncbi:DNA cytosine methyltransferase [Luteimonas sp. SMYT11W]|uniref:DNA (cytosine-5-)-methyltransferase n=1 Tax=Luteimonas flava TaxID=3115822 RepID=A0ABU7WD32_9GAMM
MADGSQHAFHLPPIKALSRLRAGEISVDLFAGGGGASTALEQALDRPVDIAINHNPWAVSMHAANHPYTRHLCEDVWEADPRREVAGRAVGWLHASPDCTHFSQAKGGQPRSRATRALSWVVLKWAGTVRPRIISLENVHQILKWGPLVAKRDAKTGRVLTLDMVPDAVTGRMIHRVAAPGERVPIDNQFLIPDKRQQGRTWRQFVAALRAMGYAVEWKRLKACDYGAGTSRERLFLIARCDGEPITWPEASHGPDRATPYVTAADCIDWSLTCPSIFTRNKPLADATLRRIARGIKRYVLDAAEPYIVEGSPPEIRHVPMGSEKADRHGRVPASVGVGTIQAGEGRKHDHRCPDGRRRRGDGVRPGRHGAGGELHRADACGVAQDVSAGLIVHATHGGERRAHSTSEPVPTITAANRGELMAVSPIVVQCANASANGVAGGGEPLGTVTAWPKGGSHAAVSAVLCGVGGRAGDSEPRSVAAPGYTTTAKADCAIAAATLIQTGYGERAGQAPRVPGLDKPVGTLVDGQKHAAVTAFLEQAAGGPNSNTSRPRAATEPVSTISTKGSQQRLCAVHLQHASTSNSNGGRGRIDLPLRTVLAGGQHHMVVEASLSPEHEAGALQVAAFLMKYHGAGANVPDLEDPISTISTKDRLALVTVTIRGTPYVIVDIGLRMLQRHELFRAQGFPAEYIIDRTADGRALSVSRSVAMVGNSVSPPPLRAIVAANLDPAEPARRAA